MYVILQGFQLLILQDFQNPQDFQKLVLQTFQGLVLQSLGFQDFQGPIPQGF